MHGPDEGSCRIVFDGGRRSSVTPHEPRQWDVLDALVATFGDPQKGLLLASSGLGGLGEQGCI